MMLAIALTEMIDNTECVFFLNSPESISSQDTIVNKTKSPWIYHELITTRIVRKQNLERELLRKSLAAKFPRFEYVVSLGHLPLLTQDHLNKWSQLYRTSASDVHPLDILYEMVPDPDK